MTAVTHPDHRALPAHDDVTATVSLLRRRFPFAVVWFGPFTRRWWAMVRRSGRWSLIEAPGPEELTWAIIRVTR